MRAFLRDKLDLPNTDVGDGWLLFRLPEAEIGVHPTEKGEWERSEERSDEPLELAFQCDDIHETVSVLKERGVSFTEDVQDQGYGLVAHFALPGDLEALLYQPAYDTD